MLWFPVRQEQNVVSRIQFHIKNEQQRIPSNSTEESISDSKILLENLIAYVSTKAKMQV